MMIKRFNTKKIVGLLLIFITLTLMLTGCLDKGNVKIGSIETSLPGYKKMAYKFFNGKEEMSFGGKKDEILTLTYKVEVDKGQLILVLIDPDGREITSKDLSEDDQGEMKLELEKDGHYKLLIKGEETQGKFEIRWEKE